MSIGLQGLRELHGSCDGDLGLRRFLFAVSVPRWASHAVSGCAAWIVRHNALVHRALVKPGGATVLGWLAVLPPLALAMLRDRANPGIIV